LAGRLPGTGSYPWVPPGRHRTIRASPIHPPGQNPKRQMASRVPAGRLAEPPEIAALVGWLAGPENTYVSGQRIVIDGGFTRV